MAVSYKRLWKLLIDKDMKKKDLAEKANISIMLDRPESDETIKGLLALSYELTKGKSKKH